MKSTDPFRAQLVVEHLGAIDRAEVTIRPLTLFFGPNGTNKTWAAYALYGLLRRFHTGDAPVDSVPESWFTAIREPIRRLRDAAGGGSTTRTTSVRLTRPERPNQLVQADLCGLMALHADEMGAARARLEIQQPRREHVDVRFDWTPDEDEIGLLRTWSASGDLAATITLGPETNPKVFLDGIWSALIEVTESVRAFPAERKALLTLHHQLSTLSMAGPQMDAIMGGVDARLSSSLVASRLKDSAASLDRSLPRPSVDFITRIDRAWHRRPDAPPGPMASVAEALEGILGGRVEFALNALGGRSPHLRFRTKNLDLPIHSTHSLARSLGGLDLYLRESAMPGDFVFIDEPEMNAHPRTQLVIAEFIALMVNAGLRVVATTHSPYIIDHLHNLIEAGRLAPDQQARFADRFELGTTDAYLSPDLVSAYHFDRGGVVTDVFDRDDVAIDWDIYGAESDDIANLYSELLAAQRDG